jgi:hypothetical protein
MKKLSVFGLVLVLLVFSAIPVLAAKPNNNGVGNGANNGQGSSVSQQARANAQARQQDKLQSRDRLNNPGVGVNMNQAGSRMRTPFYLQGTISSIDTITPTLTISVTHGNAQVKSFLGGSLLVNITDTTQFYKINQLQDPGETASAAPAANSTDDVTSGNRQVITFDQLAANDIVAIHGNVVGGVFNATVVTVYVRMPASQPEPETP